MTSSRGKPLFSLSESATNAERDNAAATAEDEITGDIIDFLSPPPFNNVSRHDSSSSSNSPRGSSNEPKRKRQKTTSDHEIYKSVIIKRTSLRATSGTGSKPSKCYPPLERQNAPAIVEIQSLTDTAETYLVTILDNSKQVSFPVLSETLFVVNAPLGDISEAMQVAKEVGKSHNPEGQGRLWTQVDIRIGSRGGLDFLEIDFLVRWNVTTAFEYLPPPRLVRPLLQTIMDGCFPRNDDLEANKEPWSPQEFYQSVHVPEKEDALETSIIATQLDTDLYPFQKRTLRWLLQREGKQPSAANKALENLPCGFHTKTLPYSFRKIIDDRGQTCYISHLFQVITLDVQPFWSTDNTLRGGILAEEMGLGKTVEIIALISLHRRQLGATGTVYDPYTSRIVRESSSTLIITPGAILSQWKSEISRHAPGLSVFHYEGVQHKSFRLLGKNIVLEKLLTSDVVLTTYDVIGKEIYYTVPPPERALRHISKYERPQSPLMQVSWWRICMDEAQMVDSGVTNAAMVAKSLPRVNSWGVTGTPIKKNVTDLLGLLIFLRFEPLASKTKIWKSLITNHRGAFKQLFSEIALRHTKQFVRDELRLPPQKRFVITMPFTPIEEQNYKSLFEEMCLVVGVDRYGTPSDEYWDPNDFHTIPPPTIRAMKHWLNRLRQTALHPEMGLANRRYIGRKEEPMRTVYQVLMAMLEQSESNLRTDQRAFLVSKLRRGQALENGPRVNEALTIWTQVLTTVREMVRYCREEIDKEKSGHRQVSVEVKGTIGTDDSDTDDQIATDTARSEPTSKTGVLKGRLRGALEVEHMALFFQANAYFQIKSNPEMTAPDSEAFKELEEKERDGYENAKKVRQELLKEVFRKADRRMKAVAKISASQSAKMPRCPSEPANGGFESRRIMDQLNRLSVALDKQAMVIEDWRNTTIEFLLRPLVDDESNGADITGMEYEESTKTQDEVMVYVQALRAVIEDRHDALTGQDNILTSSEVKTAIRLAKAKEGAFPEKILEVLAIRSKLKPKPEMGTLRTILADLRGLSNTLRIDTENGSRRAAAELADIDRQRLLAQKLFNVQVEAVNARRKEIEDFTALMNARLEYYRALQAVSDMVAPVELNDEEKPTWIAVQVREEARLADRIKITSSKLRYLDHLQKKANPDEQEMCVICQCQFDVGAMTVCGHQFCKDCIMAWWKKRHNCPTCKTGLTLQDFHDITYRPQELKVSEEIGPAIDRSPRKASSIYSDINNKVLSQIKQIELNGLSFTTKVDTLVRHLIWLRETDPGAKSLVFSQSREFIDVVRRALAAHRIGFVTFEDKENLGGAERFKRDPSIECFLLHARAHSSGLNLVAASHVILCEPLINTAIELQAIARVDRIGQQQETTVWLYLVDGTVEQSIHEISVRRRMEHIVGSASKKGKEKELSPDVLDSKIIEAANSRELQEAGSVTSLLSKEGENVRNDDLWACLFGNVGRAAPQSEILEREVGRFLRAEAADQRRVEELKS